MGTYAIDAHVKRIRTGAVELDGKWQIHGKVGVALVVFLWVGDLSRLFKIAMPQAEVG